MQSQSRDPVVMPASQGDMPQAVPSRLFEAEDPAEEELGGGSERAVYGACSAETYRAAGSLHAAHRDAGGFLDAVDRFSTPDFWRRDAAVKSWIYSGGAEAGAQGLDTVRVFYHSGHGSMEEDGQFRLPMGALWNGTNAAISSREMRLGAERLRYLFWSASESLCLRGGHAPSRTWAEANAGLRMIFGFDTVCWDSDRHGQAFWEHWRMGKSFSQSWLDAASDVSTDQIASVCAMASTPDEALERLFGERRFSATQGDPTWWVWRWTQSLAQHRRDPVTEIPRAARGLRLVHCDDDLETATGVLRQLEIDPRTIPLDRPGGLRVTSGGVTFIRSPRGEIVLEFARPSRGNRGAVSLHRRALVSRARAALRRHGLLAAGPELCFDRILLSMSAGVSLGRRPDCLPQAVDELTIQFRQCFDRIAVVSPETGWVRVVMRPDGTLLRIQSRLRRQAGPQGGVEAAHAPDPQPDVSHLLARRSALLLRDLAARGAAPLTLGILPGLTEIGYGIRSNTARLVARQGVEITCVRGFRKRYWIQSDLGD